MNVKLHVCFVTGCPGGEEASRAGSAVARVPQRVRRGGSRGLGQLHRVSAAHAERPVCQPQPQAIFLHGKPLPVRSDLFCFVQFCFVPVLFCSVPSRSFPFCFVLFRSVLFCSGMFCSVLFCSVPFCSVVSPFCLFQAVKKDANFGGKPFFQSHKKPS